MLQPLPKRAPRGYRTLYHVTLKSNADSIHAHGLSPRFAQTAAPAVYLIEHRRIVWALAHVSQRHKAHVGELDLWRCHVLVKDIRRVNGATGLWVTPYAVYFCEQAAVTQTDRPTERFISANL